MRIRLFILLFFVLSGCAGTPALPPTSGISRIEFVREIRNGQPLALEVGQDERIYIVEENKEVRILRPDGSILLTLATKIGETMLLKEPTDLAFSEDFLYITDQGLDQVSMFTLDGKFHDAFGRRGSGPKQFNNPQGIFVHKGVVYVADSGNDRIQVFGPDGVYLHAIDGRGGQQEVPSLHRLSEPRDLIIDPGGNVVVIDDDGVKVYGPSGIFMALLPEEKSPTALALGQDGFFVADRKSYSVRKYNFERQLLFSFGTKGEGRAQFLSLSALSMGRGGKVYVADKVRGVVQIFLTEEQNGQDAVALAIQMPPPHAVHSLMTVKSDKKITKTAWDGHDTLYGVNGHELFAIKNGKISRINVAGCAPVAVAVDAQGALWLLDDLQKRVVKTDSSGKIELEFGGQGRGTGKFKNPTDIAVSKAGIIYVADPANSWVQIFNKEGLFLNVLHQGEQGLVMDAPVALALNSNDSLYVLDRDLKKVFVYSSQGKLLSQFGQEGGRAGDFDAPVDLFATDTEIFVLDADTRNIKVFSEKGQFLRSFGASGQGKGDFDEPVAITGCDVISFFVTDLKNATIQQLATLYSPQTVQGLSAIGGMRQVELSWQASQEAYVEGYHLYRAEGQDGPYLLLTTVTKERYLDNQVQPGKPYYYRVTAQARAGNQSKASKEAFSIPEKFFPSQPHSFAAVPQEWQVALSWQVKEFEKPFVAYFRVLRKQQGEEYREVAQVKESTLVDNALVADTLYLYNVVTVGIDGDQSLPAALEVKTKLNKKSPLDIEIVNVRNIFSNTYKVYEETGLGTVRLTNNTGGAIGNINLLFTMKEYMDFPSEIKVDALGFGQSVELVLTPVFNNKILTVTEDTSVQTELQASYYENNERREFSKNVAVNVYEKHRMMWDERHRFATFITPKDAVLLEFVRAAVTQVEDAVEPLQRGAVVFTACSRLGITYLPDPTNPYQVTSGSTDFIDYIQYPRETLQRKSGDCDDLVALYATALESVGIQTMVVEVPGHMLMMFDAGVAGEEGSDTMDELFIVHDGRMWVAVETTLVGADFMKAWQQGSQTYYQAVKDGTLSLIDLRQAWQMFKPASLPSSSWRPAAIDLSDDHLEAELKKLKKIALALRCQHYFARLEKDPDDVMAQIQIGILYGKAGELEAAKKAFGKVLSVNTKNSDVLNNFGNIYFLEKDYQAAANMYQQAADLAAEDALIHVNLARSYLLSGQREKAVAVFARAKELDPEVSRKYRSLSLDLVPPL
jgi:DNA-binding beta-propeller fold protein YncE